MTDTLSRTSIIDSKRLWADLMSIAEFTEPDVPYTRRSFSPLFCQARAWLTKQFADAGFATQVDSAGNLIGRLQGTEPTLGTIMIGSHSDTVSGGGRFDGVAGVIAALEIGRSLKAKAGSQPLRHNLEIVDFLAEEPNAFGLSCVGSRGISGALSAEMLAYKEPGGETLGAAIARVGGSPDKIPKAKRDDVKAFFELHIEQGPVLEMESLDIGVVTAIVGIRRIEIMFHGEANHAGTTPMHMRRDSAAAAAESMVLIRKLAEQFAQQGDGHFVATIGIVENYPNAANVVPEKTRLVIDARSENRPIMEKFYDVVDRETSAIASALRVKRDPLNVLSDSMPSLCDPALRSLLSASAIKLGYSNREMASGAGHDCAFMTRISSSAMVFVPCRSGRSHASEEWAEPDALALGAATIADAIAKLDVQ